MKLSLVAENKGLDQRDEREAMIDTLRGLLQETCRLKKEGAAYARLCRSQGYADGYMKMMLDSGVATDAQLLTIVGEVRRGVDGPAVRIS